MRDYHEDKMVMAQGSQLGDFASRAGFGQSAIRSTTAFEAATETFGAAHRLVDRVQNLVNRIAGHMPPEPTMKGEMPTAVANGVLDELKDGARSAQNAIQRANDALDRLESQI